VDGKVQNLVAPKPAPRKVFGPELLDVQTPRSYQSIDSGLPDTSSTTSSTSPPGQAHQYTESEMQQHRKSTSLININLENANSAKNNQWKSYSLQRGVDVPSKEECLMLNQGPNGTVIHHHELTNGDVEQEDPYGRHTNMRLSSFSEEKDKNIPRDQRIIDLSQSTASTGAYSQGPVNKFPSNTFNTLPAPQNANHNQQPVQEHIHHPHNTLPARVGESMPGNNKHFPNNQQLIGRHFKPYDHRRMNPMAEIQENPYELQASMEYQYRPNTGQDNTYVIHHNTHIPHMPSELRHTNYRATHLPGNGVVNPQIVQHRDSANNSFASSDSS